MSNETTIEWTERTWNPIRGCKRVSPGCQNCYAEQITGRFSGTDKNGKILPFNVVTTDYIEQFTTPKEKAFGDYSAGRFAWLLRNPIELKTPIPFKGHQGMWKAPEEIEMIILKSRHNAVKEQMSLLPKGA